MTKARAFKWLLRIGIWVWVAFWISKIFWGDLGASPALKLNHEVGEIVLYLLTANLLVGILLDVLKPPPKWVRFWLSERRFWGVSTFLILVGHVLFYLLNEGFEAKAFTQMVTKTYLIFGGLAFLILFAMAVTSNDFSVRKLGGKNWKRLHRAVYLAQFLIMGHLLLIEKADFVKYGIWMGSLLILQAARWILHWSRRRKKA